MCPLTLTLIAFAGTKIISLMHHKQNSYLKLLPLKKMSLSTVTTVQITKLNESRFREEAVDIFRVKKAAKRSFLCKDRREFGSLQFTIGNLQKTSENNIKEYEDNKRNLQWFLYNLQLQRTGKIYRQSKSRTQIRSFTSYSEHLIIFEGTFWEHHL